MAIFPVTKVQRDSFHSTRHFLIVAGLEFNKTDTTNADGLWVSLSGKIEIARNGF